MSEPNPPFPRSGTFQPIAPPPVPAQPTVRQSQTPSELTDPDGVPRNWLKRWKRVTQPTPPDIDTGPISSPSATSLLLRNPFHLGFFATAGGLTAYGLSIGLTQLSGVITLILLAMMVALGLDQAVSWLHHRGIRRGICVVLVALLVLVVVGLAFWAVIPMLIEQATSLSGQIPTIIDNLRQNEQIALIDEQFEISSRFLMFLTSGELVTWLFGSVAGTAWFITNALVSTVLTVVVTIYFLASMPAIKELFYSLAPASRRPRAKYLVNEIFKKVGVYVSGLFFVATMAALYTLIVLSIIGIPEGFNRYALALAAMLMILYFIPLVGSTIAILAIAGFGFTYSPITGILCLVLLFAYQQFDAYFIAPKVYSKSVQVPGVAVILAVASGGYLTGSIIGAILGVPLMAALVLLYREVLLPHLNRR
ncbi:MAG: AI-2E family transporter [Propionibacteriaceae bacterium]|nr:AI-2E family transporter [Propionibacteriaceae bacterium]